MKQLAMRNIHLDFHTPSLPYRLGKNFNKERFQQLLLRGHVQSITLTARCHHGHLYYASSLPAMHPQMTGDFLKELVTACHEINVACPLYITAGWDAQMAAQHPEWLECQPDGQYFGFEEVGQLQPGWKTLCFNSPYRQYLLTQTEELLAHFSGQLDGLFYDIVKQDACCCNFCLTAMLGQGYDPQQLKARQLFSQQVVASLKQDIKELVTHVDPDCPIFFNEGNITPRIRHTLDTYSHLEIESLASGGWGYQHFPVTVRYAKNLGKQYLGMTGKFHGNWGDFGSYKNQAALEYECFLAIAHGAKCSIGDQMYGDGTLQPATYELIGNVYQEVAALEPWLTEVEAVTELAVLHPYSIQQGKERIPASLAGAVNLLRELHYQFDVIDAQMAFSRYKLLVLPDTISITDALAQQLKHYMAAGGKVLATYQSLREDVLPVEEICEAEFLPMYGVFKEGPPALTKGETVLHGKGLYVVAKENTRQLGELWEPMYNRTYQHYYSHYQAPLYQQSAYPLAVLHESCCYFPHELFTMYKQRGMKEYREMIALGINQLLPDTLVVTNAPAAAELVLNHQPAMRRFVLHYLYYQPQQQATEIPTIEAGSQWVNTELQLNLSTMFQQVKAAQQPIQRVYTLRQKEDLSFQQDAETLQVCLPLVTGYEVLVLDY